MMRKLLAVAVAALLSLPGLCLAGPPLPTRTKPVSDANRANAMKGLRQTKNFGDRVPTSEEVVEALAPDAASPKDSEGYNTRSVRPSQEAKANRAVSMEINFEINSFRLTSKATEMLAVLGKSLRAERLRELQFVVEGHTDASGSAEHNMRLSRQRAKAVKDYLVTHFKLDRTRFQAVGRGEDQPIAGMDPYASQNRRVEIVSQ